VSLSLTVSRVCLPGAGPSARVRASGVARVDVLVARALVAPGLALRG
jgi:hypothetical protein